MQGDDADLALLTRAARAAGPIALKYFRNAPKSWEKRDDQGPVTIADIEVNTLLHKMLRGARPGYGWMSEETLDNHADRLDTRDVFIIDPIDGTRAFLEGTSAFAHAIAVARGGEVRAAVVFLPAQDRLYAARLGGGATLNDQPIRAAGDRPLADAQILATRKTFDPAQWPGGAPKAGRAYRPSLAYRLCLVAEGRFDAMVTLRDSWEWDTAAGTLIAHEAGAVVTDASGGMLRFNSKRRMHPGCIAASPAIHADLLARR